MSNLIRRNTISCIRGSVDDLADSIEELDLDLTKFGKLLGVSTAR